MCLWIYSSIQLENQIVKLWMTLDVYWNRIYIEDRVAAMPDDITENFRNVGYSVNNANWEWSLQMMISIK